MNIWIRCSDIRIWQNTKSPCVFEEKLQGFRGILHFPDQFRWHISFHQETPKVAVEGFHGIILFGIKSSGNKIIISLCMHIQANI